MERCLIPPRGWWPVIPPRFPRSILGPEGQLLISWAGEEVEVILQPSSSATAVMLQVPPRPSFPLSVPRPEGAWEVFLAEEGAVGLFEVEM